MAIHHMQCHSIACNPNDDLAKVPALKKGDEGFGCSIEAIDDIFAVTQATIVDPRGYILRESWEMTKTLGHDETAQQQAFA